MKIGIAIIGILTVLAGILPLAAMWVSFIPPQIISGWIYTAIVAGIGIIGLIYGFVSYDLFGAQKVIMIALALLTVFGGVLPFVASLWSPLLIVTSSNYFYPGAITLVGLGTTIYGFTQW